MNVTMRQTITESVNDGATAQAFEQGASYEVPDAIAADWIARGDAYAVSDVPETLEVTDVLAVSDVPETLEVTDVLAVSDVPDVPETSVAPAPTTVEEED